MTFGKNEGEQSDSSTIYWERPCGTKSLSQWSESLWRQEEQQLVRQDDIRKAFAVLEGTEER